MEYTLYQNLYQKKANLFSNIELFLNVDIDTINSGV